jgi:hypothetical protein
MPSFVKILGVRLTPRQIWALKRVQKDNAISPDVARQLVKKGLVYHAQNYERTEWNRVVAVLWVCILTDAGKAVFAALEEK